MTITLGELREKTKNLPDNCILQYATPDMPDLLICEPFQNKLSSGVELKVWLSIPIIKKEKENAQN